MKNNWFAFAAALTVAAFGLACAGNDDHADENNPQATAEKATFGKMTPEQVWEALDSGEEIFIYDNNSREVYAQGHVPGAQWVDFQSVDASVLPENKDAKLVFYCANTMCEACHVGANAAIALGYTNVHIMPEGIAGWKEKGMSVQSVSLDDIPTAS